MSDMNPAEKYAALKLLQHAVGEAVKSAAEGAEMYREAVRAKQLETDFGVVGVTRRAPSVELDPAEFLAWVERERPDEIVSAISPDAVGTDEVIAVVEAYDPSIIVRSVRPSFATTWAAHLEVADDEVIDPISGELQPYARVKPGSQFLTCRLSAAAKSVAVEQLQRQLDSVARLALGTGEDA